eukprot:TRINITY_DN3180_c0_g1_i1.p1 TRINITY_DN3180_c0_g1~~TRINITY_DN3180_c0_g1_i1.p1  ORF type:complete len:422 (+),score=36.54 TRINITY_DN3180_c0_g1_i1:97-1362(+)
MHMYKRIDDVRNEHLQRLGPLFGLFEPPYETTDSVQELMSELDLDHQKTHMQVTLDLCHTEISNNQNMKLSLIQLFVIKIYTLNWPTGFDSLYIKLNNALRTEDRNILNPWRHFIYHLMSALWTVDNVVINRPIYRAVKGLDLKSRYQVGSIITWNAFSSATTKLNVLQDHLGDEEGTIFIITPINARLISKYSFYPGEKEVLIPLCSKFKVTGVYKNNRVCMISLQQEESTEQRALFSKCVKQKEIIPQQVQIENKNNNHNISFERQNINILSTFKEEHKNEYIEKYKELSIESEVNKARNNLRDYWNSMITATQHLPQWKLDHHDSFLIRALNHMDLVEPFDEAVYEKCKFYVRSGPYWEGKNRPWRYDWIEDRYTQELARTDYQFPNPKYTKKRDQLREIYTERIPARRYDLLIQEKP